jgi:hypothetical protein
MEVRFLDLAGFIDAGKNTKASFAFTGKGGRTAEAQIYF